MKLVGVIKLSEILLGYITVQGTESNPTQKILSLKDITTIDTLQTLQQENMIVKVGKYESDSLESTLPYLVGAPTSNAGNLQVLDEKVGLQVIQENDTPLPKEILDTLSQALMESMNISSTSISTLNDQVDEFRKGKYATQPIQQPPQPAQPAQPIQQPPQPIQQPPQPAQPVQQPQTPTQTPNTERALLSYIDTDPILKKAYHQAGENASIEEVANNYIDILVEFEGRDDIDYTSDDDEESSVDYGETDMAETFQELGKSICAGLLHASALSPVELAVRLLEPDKDGNVDIGFEGYLINPKTYRVYKPYQGGVREIDRRIMMTLSQGYFVDPKTRQRVSTEGLSYDEIYEAVIGDKIDSNIKVNHFAKVFSYKNKARMEYKVLDIRSEVVGYVLNITSIESNTTRMGYLSSDELTKIVMKDNSMFQFEGSHPVIRNGILELEGEAPSISAKDLFLVMYSQLQKLKADKNAIPPEQRIGTLSVSSKEHITAMYNEFVQQSKQQKPAQPPTQPPTQQQQPSPQQQQQPTQQPTQQPAQQPVQQPTQQAGGLLGRLQQKQQEQGVSQPVTQPTQKSQSEFVGNQETPVAQETPATQEATTTLPSIPPDPNPYDISVFPPNVGQAYLMMVGSLDQTRLGLFKTELRGLVEKYKIN